VHAGSLKTAELQTTLCSRTTLCGGDSAPCRLLRAPRAEASVFLLNGIVGLDDIRKPGPAGGPALMEPHEVRRRWPLDAETKGASEALGRLIDAVSQLSLPPTLLRDRGPFLSPVDVDSGQKRLGSNHGSWRGVVAEEETNVRPLVDTGELRCWTARVHSELLGGGVLSGADELLDALKAALGDCPPSGGGLFCGEERRLHGGESRARLRQSDRICAWLAQDRFRRGGSVRSDPLEAMAEGRPGLSSNRAPTLAAHSRFSIDCGGYVACGGVRVDDLQAAATCCASSAVAQLYAVARIKLEQLMPGIAVYADESSVPATACLGSADEGGPGRGSRNSEQRGTYICVSATRTAFARAAMAEQASGATVA
jgi:hypothetical protein